MDLRTLDFNKLKIIKYTKKTIIKKVLTDEIIDKKVKMFKEVFRKMKIENIGENTNIEDLLDLKGLEEENRVLKNF
ncbi:MAG: hypothetical protein LBD03_09495 [Methanobrevibacter sp.]|jgi:hypothetical protein|nr:hypothetical protein [Candidatus Methanovirga procula]